MDKNATYKEKYAHLKEWMPMIIEAVKKDLKNEHLKKDFYFIKKFLSSKNVNKVTTEEFVEAYSKAIAEEDNGEALGEFITSRWLLKNTEIYDFFERQLREVHPEFSEIEELDKTKALQLMEDSANEFGAPKTYLFAILNSVVFPKDVFQQLRERAKQEVTEEEQERAVMSEKMTMENMQKAFEQHVARLTDKYEKKLSGLQKKYSMDVESLKKQVSNLQRKLQEKLPK